MRDPVIAFVVMAVAAFVGEVLAKIAWFTIVMDRVVP